MTALDQARQILENMLGYLGFFVTIEEDDSPEGPTLQILTEDSERLIGKRGEVLDDIQYLVNRLLMRRMPDAPRIRVDVDDGRVLAQAIAARHRHPRRIATDELLLSSADPQCLRE